MTVSAASTSRIRARVDPRLPAVVAVAVGWLLTLPRMVPGTFGDHGTFISVAERILAGDRLYVDVWDNKDPLFYYVLALARLASPLGDIVLEVLWVVLAAASVLVLARAAGASGNLALVAGFGATPLLLTGAAYEPGLTHLPGIALLLAAAACAVRSRWVAAGVLAGLLLFTKLVLVPVLVGALVVVAVHRRGTDGLSGVVRAALGAVGLVVVGVAAMALHGDLPGWVDNFRYNADYANGQLADSRYGSVVGHLLRAFPEDSRGGGAVTIMALVVVLLAVPRSWRPGAATGAVTGAGTAIEPPDDHADVSRTISPAALWDLCLVSLVVGLVVIGATATWPHHAQTLSAAGGFALALLATRLTGNLRGPLPSALPAGRATALLLIAGFAMAGAVHPYNYLMAARGAPTNVRGLQSQSPESVLLQSMPQVRTYARAGTNDVSAHAVGLRHLTLACPRFHQYSLYSPDILREIAQCLPRADALIVDDSLRPEPDQPAWNAYVDSVHALVSRGYDCTRVPAAQVCVRRTR